MLSRHQQVLAPTVPFVRIKPVADGDDGRYEIEWEDVPRREINLRSRVEARLPETISLTGNQGLTLRTLLKGATMSAFVLSCQWRSWPAWCAEKVCAAIKSPRRRVGHWRVGDSLLVKGSAGVRRWAFRHPYWITARRPHSPSGTLLAYTIRSSLSVYT